MKPRVQRHCFGIGACVSLATVAAILLGGWDWPEAVSFFGRLGLLLGVVWLAFNDLQRIPSWLFAAIAASAVVLIIRPKLFIFLVPVLIILAAIKKFLVRK
jgi:hypothetical protein